MGHFSSLFSLVLRYCSMLQHASSKGERKRSEARPIRYAGTWIHTLIHNIDPDKVSQTTRPTVSCTTMNVHNELHRTQSGEYQSAAGHPGRSAIQRRCRAQRAAQNSDGLCD